MILIAQSDAEAAREAYDAFLSHYPYCYGYWRKYADYEKRKGIKANCNAVSTVNIAFMNTFAICCIFHYAIYYNLIKFKINKWNYKNRKTSNRIRGSEFF